MFSKFQKMLLCGLAVMAFSLAANAQLITEMDVFNQNRFCDATVTAWYQCGGCGSGVTPVTQVVPSGQPAFFPSSCGTTPTTGWVLFFTVDYGFGPVDVDLAPCSFVSQSGTDFAIDCQGIPMPFTWTTTPQIWVPGTIGNVHVDLY